MEISALLKRDLIASKQEVLQDYQGIYNDRILSGITKGPQTSVPRLLFLGGLIFSLLILKRESLC